MIIKNQKNGSLSEVDRLELARILVKAGYMVRIGKMRPPGKSSGQMMHFVEYWDDASDKAVQI